MTTDSASASAPLVFISATESVLPESHADLTLAETLMDLAHARLVSPTIQECARDALKAHSGVHLPINASSYADKTQPTPHQPANVSATRDSDYFQAHVKPALIITSFPTDTV